MRRPDLRVGVLAAVALAGLLSGCQPGTAPTAAPPAAPNNSATADPGCVQPGPASDAVTVTGDLFAAPKVSFPVPLSATGVERSVVVMSEGETAEPGDLLHVAYQVYSGETGKLIESTNFGVKELLPLYFGGSLIPGLRDAFACATTGSRVVVTIPPAKAYGDQGRQDLAVAAGETVVFVIDIDSVTKEADLPTE